MVLVVLPGAFQFHKGTIKTVIWESESSEWIEYFNSIKVRLKLLAPLGGTGRILFQFHKGTIKTFFL